MGTWGHRLYDNDTSLDVKDQFEEELHRGKTVEDITQLMINDYECNLDIPYEAFLFWGALADTQWNWGMLLPQVQQQALHWIQELQENGVGLSAEQQKVLDDLAQNFCLPSLQFGSHAREDYISANGKSEMCLLSKWKEKKQRSEIFTAGSS